MEPKEIRIGNYLKDNNGVVIQVYGINDCVLLKNKHIVPLRSINKIPLTKEWLLKFGFINQFPKHPNGFYVLFIDNNISLSFNYSAVLNVNIKNYGVILSFKDFNVHELQNLYFSLTRQELIIKNKD